MALKLATWDEIALIKKYAFQVNDFLKKTLLECGVTPVSYTHLREDYRITREHGQWVEKAGVAMTALYHPAAILRDPGKRPETFDDLKSLQAKIRQVCSRTYEST